MILLCFLLPKILRCYKLNKDLATIKKWAYLWKMIFNPNLLKEAQKVIFSQQFNKPSHLPLVFNSSNVTQGSCQKGMILDSKLLFDRC